MPLDYSPPLWLLWTAVTLGAAAAGVVVATRGTRRRSAPVADITIQALPGTKSLLHPAAGSGRAAKPPAFLPAPAPLASPPAADGQDQRTTYRRVGNAVLVTLADPDGRQPPRHAWVIDRSRHGLRLASEQRLAIGQVYLVRPAEAPPATPWTALEVRHCTAVDGHWEAGCRFRPPPPLTLLMHFG